MVGLIVIPLIFAQFFNEPLIGRALERERERVTVLQISTRWCIIYIRTFKFSRTSFIPFLIFIKVLTGWDR